MCALRAIKIIFTTLGLLMLAGATALLINTMNFIDRAETAPGTIVELVAKHGENGTTYAPVYRYSVANETYQTQSSSSSSPPSYAIGESVQVLYDPEEPSDGRLDGTTSLWLGPIILYVLGGVFLLIGLGMVLYSFFKGRGIKRLLTTGKPTAVQVVHFEENTSVAVNNKHPLRIVGKGLNPVTQQLETFLSGNLWTYPAAFEPGAWVTAYVDPQKPSKHHIELQRPDEALIVQSSVAIPDSAQPTLSTDAAPDSPYTVK